MRNQSPGKKGMCVCVGVYACACMCMCMCVHIKSKEKLCSELLTPSMRYSLIRRPRNKTEVRGADVTTDNG